MTVPSLGDILRVTGVPDLVEILAQRLNPQELDAVLWEAHRQRASRTTPAQLLQRYQSDPSVRPSPADVSTILAFERFALSVAAPPFEPLDLSPICPGGAESALAPVDPGAAWGAGGTSEVVSDCASVLALEAALRRRDAPHAPVIRLCAAHRELHAPYSAPLRSEPHARVLALCTAGTDDGGYRLETSALREQLDVHLRLLDRLSREGFPVGAVRAALFGRPDPDLQRAILEQVVEPLSVAHPGARFTLDGDHSPARRYYAPVGFGVQAEDDAEVEHPIGVGGFTDWTRQLLGRSDERLLVSTIAIERMGDAFGGGAGSR